MDNNTENAEVIYVLDSDLKDEVMKKIILSLVGVVVIEVSKPLVKMLTRKMFPKHFAAIEAKKQATTEK